MNFNEFQRISMNFKEICPEAGSQAAWVGLDTGWQMVATVSTGPEAVLLSSVTEAQQEAAVGDKADIPEGVLRCRLGMTKGRRSRSFLAGVLVLLPPLGLLKLCQAQWLKESFFISVAQAACEPGLPDSRQRNVHTSPCSLCQAVCLASKQPLARMGQV